MPPTLIQNVLQLNYKNLQVYLSSHLGWVHLGTLVRTFHMSPTPHTSTSPGTAEGQEAWKAVRASGWKRRANVRFIAPASKNLQGADWVLHNLLKASKAITERGNISLPEKAFPPLTCSLESSYPTPIPNPSCSGGACIMVIHEFWLDKVCASPNLWTTAWLKINFFTGMQSSSEFY